MLASAWRLPCWLRNALPLGGPGNLTLSNDFIVELPKMRPSQPAVSLSVAIAKSEALQASWQVHVVQTLVVAYAESNTLQASWQAHVLVL